MSFSLPIGKFKIACECGASVYPKSLQDHKLSRSHMELMKKAFSLDQKGGSDGLFQCQCGLYVAHKQAKAHCAGKKHDHYIGNRIRGGKRCGQCQLYYTQMYCVHLMDDEHGLNIERRQLFLYQTQMAAEKITEKKQIAHENFAAQSIHLLDVLTHEVNQRTTNQKNPILTQRLRYEANLVEEEEKARTDFLFENKSVTASTFSSDQVSSQSKNICIQVQTKEEDHKEWSKKAKKAEVHIQLGRKGRKRRKEK